MSSIQILIVEDEARIADILKLYLEAEGFRVNHAKTAKEALDFVKKEPPDLMLLDLILPDMDGEDLCTIIKRDHDIPVIMLTAKSSEEQKVKGLDAGADDYVVKPFSPKELMARIRAILRRTGKKSRRLSFNSGQLIIDLQSHEVLINKKPVTLTDTEFRILYLFASKPSQIFTREEIIRSALGYDFEGYDRTIDAHIKNIRHKIEIFPKKPGFIKTVYGVGYKFTGVPDED